MAEERQPVVSRARDTTDAGTLSTTRRAGYIASLCICGIFRRSSDASPSSGTGAIQRHRPRALHRTRRQVNQLAANMNTNMAELMGMLRNQNRTSSSYTPPPEYRPTVDLNQVVPPIYVTDNEDLSFSTMAYAPAVHPVNDPLPPPPAPTAVPLLPAAFLSTDSAMHTLPPLAMPAQSPIYTIPPPMVPPQLKSIPGHAIAPEDQDSRFQEECSAPCNPPSKRPIPCKPAKQALVHPAIHRTMRLCILQTPRVHPDF
ncbi:hypothetical protein CRG98_010086 [Punica granatum]|uniref:Uncharacterized protein n=1 Tax=Punica granatum TaxID=22663 RepID=A0A2I0KLZ0_PUNGR|nr:hypothetical protein CRG98_010086 [Punica granatum]